MAKAGWCGSSSSTSFAADRTARERRTNRSNASPSSSAARQTRLDFDAVILATPQGLNEIQVLAAIAAGKGVFCEKPPAMAAAGAQLIGTGREAWRMGS